MFADFLPEIRTVGKEIRYEEKIEIDSGLADILSEIGKRRREIMSMKDKIKITVCTVMLLIPWTILYLRRFDWALESPVAEIMIASYAVFMIFSGVFTIVAYTKNKLQNTLMKICLVINGLYGVGIIAALCMMILPKVME